MAKRSLLPAKLLLLAGSTAVALPLCAQGTAPATSPPAYDVVAIKPHKSSDGSWSTNTQANGYSATNINLKRLIQDAYNLQTEDMISGLPGWANSASFDIQAKMDEDLMATLSKLPREEKAAQRRAMMQTLLADRFQLKIHHETRDLPIYSLALAKGGFKLKPVGPNEPQAGSWTWGDGRFTTQAVPISSFVSFLSSTLHRLVVDNTALSGNYDITLRWSPDEVAGAQQDPTASTAPSLFTALQEQLGLKLESTKGPVDTIVVDQLAQPSEN
jgi:uncharacterized protein (TIGR03435 family)